MSRASDAVDIDGDERMNGNGECKREGGDMWTDVNVKGGLSTSKKVIGATYELCLL